jgi:hypothetical protein
MMAVHAAESLIDAQKNIRGRAHGCASERC